MTMCSSARCGTRKPIYEIKPAVAYTRADLDWTNKQSRSTVEMQDKSCRPELADHDAPVADAGVDLAPLDLQCRFHGRSDRHVGHTIQLPGTAQRGVGRNGDGQWDPMDYSAFISLIIISQPSFPSLQIGNTG